MKKIALILLLFACNSQEKNSANNVINEPIEEQYTLKVVEIDSLGFGYQIFDEGNLIINQKHIPAVQGIKRFKTHQQAKEIGEYVIQKIESGNFPPTLSKEELYNFNAIDSI